MYECWMWIEQLPDGTEGVIAAIINGNLMPLHSRREDICRSMRPFALAHSESIGSPIRMVHLKEVRMGRKGVQE